MVRFGTKWLSMTSTWTQSASPTAMTSSASRAKSADRMLGDICTANADCPFRPVCRAAAERSLRLGRVATVTRTQQREGHRVGAVSVRPQLYIRPGAERRHRRQRAARVDPVEARPAGPHLLDDSPRLQ